MYFNPSKQTALNDHEIVNFNNVVEVSDKFRSVESSHKDQKLGPESL